MARFRNHRDQKKIVRNCLFHIMKLFYEQQSKTNIAQNLVKIRKCRLPKNKTTFFLYFLNRTLMSKKAPFKKCVKKSGHYIFKKK